ncbi:hypothetical protein [Rubrivirga sp. IMCC45206]|uniref:hypothetical protein n=1 Tax=Rubrivirga sp. IMCC45206 TaxID=3391614 RepID=UPI00398FB0BF
MGLAFALCLGVVSGVFVLLGVREWRAPVDLADDDWGHEAGWAAMIRGYAVIAVVLGALGLAVAVGLAVAG